MGYEARDAEFALIRGSHWLQGKKTPRIGFWLHNIQYKLYVVTYPK